MRLGELSHRLAHLACAAAATAGMGVAQCWQWSDGFAPDLTGYVRTIEYYDGALYVGGAIQAVGSARVRSIACWDGSEWSDVGNGVNGVVYAAMAFDDGRGEALIVGGDFSQAGDLRCGGIARWDGRQWSPMGVGFEGEARSFAVFDDGSGDGAQLYAGGAFRSPLHPFTNHFVLRWNGEQWEPIASRPTINSTVNDMAVYDDGSGPALYAAGAFNNGWGGLTIGIARWDGAEWSDVGGGLDSATDRLYDLEVFDDGQGPALFIAGDFDGVGAVDAESVAKWNGSGWAAIGDNEHHQSYIRSMAVFDDGDGPALFTAATHGAAAGRWDGSHWTQPEFGAGRPHVLATFPFAPRILFMGADRLCLGGECASGFLGWDGERIHRFGTGQGFQTATRYAESLGEGAERRLYVAGTVAGSLHTGGVAVWNGSRWRALGRCPAWYITDFELFDDGTGNGEELYVAGEGGWPLAKWTGTRWVQADLPGASPGHASALAVFDDGTGPTLYAAGLFGLPSDPNAWTTMVKWNGTSWRAVPSAPHGLLTAMIVDDTPTRGPNLYVAGRFSHAGGNLAHMVARWDGVRWSALGAGLDTERLTDLCFFDDGTGRQLYASGGWPENSTQPLLSRWDGSAWHTVVTGMGPLDAIRALQVFDDGRGPALIAAGHFGTIDGVLASDIARWDGTAWSTLGRGLQAVALSLATFDGDLYVAGHIKAAGRHLSSNFARWFDACK